jgi:hypothetical protein
MIRILIAQEHDMMQNLASFTRKNFASQEERVLTIHYHTAPNKLGFVYKIEQLGTENRWLEWLFCTRKKVAEITPSGVIVYDKTFFSVIQKLVEDYNAEHQAGVTVQLNENVT